MRAPFCDYRTPVIAYDTSFYNFYTAVLSSSLEFRSCNAWRHSAKFLPPADRIREDEGRREVLVVLSDSFIFEGYYLGRLSIERFREKADINIFFVLNPILNQ